VLLAVGALGVSCVATQLVLMREMLCVFAGNELVLGIVLGNWLLLMGAGAWLGRWAAGRANRLDFFLGGQVTVALLPLLQLVAVRLLPVSVFLRGAAVGLQATAVSSFLVLLPYCLTAGGLLTVACAIRVEPGRAGEAGRVYVADSLGSILGGAAASLLLVWVLDSFALLAAVGVLNLALAAVLSQQAGRTRLRTAALLTLVCLAACAFVLQPDQALTAWRYPSEAILFRGHSPYGQLVVTRTGGQLNFIQNGLPVLATHNIEQVEEAVHYALAQRPAARRVLLIGGGVAGTAKELLKYPAEVTYVELDPLFLELGRRFLPENLADARIRVVNTDGRRFVQTTRQQFDVILVDLADPVTAQLNRFHTAEFFAEAKRALAPEGVLALAVGRYENFVSPELARVLATTHRTLRGVFAQVIPLPGGRVFWLASDAELHRDIAARLDGAGVATRFVNRHYLDAVLTPDRLAAVQRATVGDGPVNRDFNPVLYFYCLRHWASQFESQAGWVGMAAGVALLVYVARLRGAAAVVFAGGFAASSLEVVLLLAFQALCGSLYYQLGIVVTVFMAGLAVGAAWANRGSRAENVPQTVARAVGPAESPVCPPAAQPGWGGASGANQASRQAGWLPLEPAGQRGVLAALALGITGFGLALPWALRVLSGAAGFCGSAFLVQAAILGLTFSLAALVGAEFPVANRLGGPAAGATAARMYTADFLGASVGALLASAWLIPVLGVARMCLLAAALNLLGAAAVIATRSRPV